MRLRAAVAPDNIALSARFPVGESDRTLPDDPKPHSVSSATAAPITPPSKYKAMGVDVANAYARLHD